MTNNSEIARLSEALQNRDWGPEHAGVPAQEQQATPTTQFRESTDNVAFSALIEYAMIAAYVVLAAAIFLPPSVCSMSKVIGNLLRNF